MSSPGSSDSELQRAIALSLKDDISPKQSRGEPEVVVLSDSEDEAEIPKMAPTSESRGDGLVTSGSGDNQSCPAFSGAEGYLDDYQNKILDQKVPAERKVATSSLKTLPQGVSSAKSTSQPTLLALHTTTAPHNISSIWPLDRKKMEEERLARARKRKAPSISPPPSNRKPMPLDQLQASTELSGSRPSKRSGSQNASREKPLSSEGRLDFSIPAEIMDSRPLALSECTSAVLGAPVSTSKVGAAVRATLPSVLSYKQQVDLMKSGVHFPDGVVKRTWAQGYPREDDIKIEEVLQKNDLDTAVLSAFQWDPDWILDKLDMARTRLICVMQAKTEEEKSRMRAGVPPRIRFCFPSMEGQINCMHSKLQLLAHPTHLRVVVSSANLVPYDWGEGGGVMENTVFIIDLPRIPHGKTVDTNSSTPFQRELIHFLKAMEMDWGVIDSFVKFDFSRTARLAFVHSIGGSHVGSAWKHTGYTGLGLAIRELGLARKQPLDIDVVSASIGSLTDDFIKSIYLAAQGDNGMTELDWRVNRASKSKALSSRVAQTQAEEQVSKEVEQHFRIYFPSRDTVIRSKGGIGAGGTICFQPKWYDSDKFPKSLMRDCKSQRPGMLMHNKMIFARPQTPIRGNDDKLYAAWVYVGSANLSESAWGRLVMDKSSKTPKMNLRNWECGVVVTVPVMDENQLAHDGQSKRVEGVGKGKDVDINCPTMDVFEGRVPVPMAVPGEVYGAKRPWFYAEA